MTKTPIAAENPIGHLLTVRQGVLGVTDEKIAEALGYEDERTVAMIKSGRLRLPLSKVKAFANVLELDPGQVLAELLRTTDPAILDAIESCLGPLYVTPDELRVIGELRRAADGRVLSPMILERDSVVALLVA